jgi:hypothetical protein
MDGEVFSGGGFFQDQVPIEVNGDLGGALGEVNFRFGVIGNGKVDLSPVQEIVADDNGDLFPNLGGDAGLTEGALAAVGKPSAKTSSLRVWGSWSW